jgi:hypothetical protein
VISCVPERLLIEPTLTGAGGDAAEAGRRAARRALQPPLCGPDPVRQVQGPAGTPAYAKRLFNSDCLHLRPSCIQRSQACLSYRPPDPIDPGRFSLGDFVGETQEEREQRQFGGLSAEEQAMIAEADRRD